VIEAVAVDFVRMHIYLKLLLAFIPGKK
jgi:hypothetical protein